MQIVLDIAVVFLAYLLGAIPFGLLVVKLKTGQDIREIESGRTGSTNAMRAAGFWAGMTTVMLDIAKGAVSVWAASWLDPHNYWLHVAAPIVAIIGHNHSIFVPERDENGRIVGLRGGAGGVPAVGGAVGLWPASILILVPLGMLIFFSIGIASVATVTAALLVIILFAIRAAQGHLPWIYVWYGVGAEILLMWALRPNLKKLFAGEERVIKYSFYGWLLARREGAKKL
jgi:glycerol-3-phosphate acyltransferase PlsY